ncbi:peptidase [Xenorhabdus stockiae]|uniref:Peptidase n=2 Tax=Xenorhabdus stockiae TaxID=351614 RepID=A0A2D0KB64_9GAMM|nr:peptidase [Xenorhabdus stockiae]
MGLLVGMFWFYYSEYQDKAEEYTSLKLQYDAQVIAINKQQERLEQLAKLDEIYIEKLANAKTEIDTLRADVATGRRKLRIKATCPVREATPSVSVVNATTVELPRETGQTVLDIREDIINDRAKLRYLQDYIKTECQ